MSDEKHPNPRSAAGKLDGLDFLPDETRLDKTLAWEKLYSRIRQKQDRKTGGWYRLVAASVLCALLLYGITRPHTGRDLAKHNTKNRGTIIPALPQQPARKSNAGGAESLALKTNKSVQGTLLPHSHNNRARLFTRDIHPAVQDFTPGTAIMAPKSDLPVSEAAALPVDAGTTEKVVPPIAKRKLRVVHMNELDEPMEADDNLVKNSGRHGFRLKWIGQTSALNTFQATGQTYNELIKINLPSPN
ncbi:MAG TPA: hypothetical protein VGM24_11385 [Puia sp.]|jgi:hypothetical protein